jgi:SAM-dependent methyltransferase
LTDWGLTHIPIEKDFTILDVGCGGGRTIQKLAAATQGMVYGVDYAKGSVAGSRAKNSQLVEAGRVEIKHASVSQLPFPDNKFNLVTAVETQYYWPDLPNDMLELLRVLKPGGTLAIIAESYKEGKHDIWKQPVMKLLKSTSLGVDDQRALFSSAGYTDVQIFEERSKGWICVTGKKPANPPNSRSSRVTGNRLNPHGRRYRTRAESISPDIAPSRKRVDKALTFITWWSRSMLPPQRSGGGNARKNR